MPQLLHRCRIRIRLNAVALTELEIGALVRLEDLLVIKAIIAAPWHRR
jgi:hypothetical protein